MSASEPLPAAQAVARAGVRTDQARSRFPPVPAARLRNSARRVATIAVMARDKLLAFLTRRDIEATNTSPAAPLAVIRYALAALRPSEPPPHQVDRGD